MQTTPLAPSSAQARIDLWCAGLPGAMLGRLLTKDAEGEARGARGGISGLRHVMYNAATVFQLVLPPALLPAWGATPRPGADGRGQAVPALLVPSHNVPVWRVGDMSPAETNKPPV